MALPTETVTFDVHDFKVYPLTADSSTAPTYGPAVDVPGIQSVSVSPEFVTQELKGDAKVLARKGKTASFTCSATYALLSNKVLAAIFGGTQTSNPTPESDTWKLLGTNSLPYFKAAFAIDEASTGVATVHVTLYKCQVTGGSLFDQSTDEFGTHSMDISAIPCVSNDEMILVEILAAATALPASAQYEVEEQTLGGSASEEQPVDESAA